MDLKKCLTCDKPVRGRSDKKFCNDYCRNAYNNKTRSVEEEPLKYVNRILSKNRNILQGQLGENNKMVKVKKERLLEMGFVFRYVTHYHKNKKGTVYFLCYDHGYLPVEEDCYVVFLSEQLKKY